MRRALAAALGGATALLLVAGSADAALEPVTITPTAPGTVTAGTPFTLAVAVEAEAGAFDIAAQPLLLGVKLAPECGGSLVGTPGASVLERTLPTVPAGSSFKQTFSAEVTTSTSGTEVICAFLQDSQERQFATDTEAEVMVKAASGAGAGAAAHQKQCAGVTKRLIGAKRSLKRLDKRIRKTRSRLRHAQGSSRSPVAKKLHRLRAKRHKLAKRRRHIANLAAGCS